MIGKICLKSFSRTWPYGSRGYIVSYCNLKYRICEHLSLVPVGRHFSWCALIILRGLNSCDNNFFDNSRFVNYKLFTFYNVLIFKNLIIIIFYTL